MTIEAEALRALSEKATGGDWTHRPWTTGNGNVVYEDREIMSDGDRASVADSLSVEDADFLVALVSAYRSGDLIHRSVLAKETARAVEGWEPIEDAPPNGSYIVANDVGEVCPAQARDGQRIVQNAPGYADWSFGHRATHWRPLPAPPALPLTPEAPNADR